VHFNFKKGGYMKSEKRVLKNCFYVNLYL